MRVKQIKYIGKESNSLEDMKSGLVQSAQSVYTEYSAPRRGEWTIIISPALKNAPLKILVEKSGIGSQGAHECEGRAQQAASQERGAALSDS